jgi:hypothetical protein
VNSCTLFETVAAATWRRIRDGHDYSVRQGEEGLSDWLLLELVAAGLRDVRLAKTNKAREAKQGTDWEWWIGNGAQGWLRYAVQAKLIDVDSERFPTITHFVNNTLQVDILERYAARQRAIPIYCFYSFLRGFPSARGAAVLPAVPIEQFGCSVAPLSTVRAAIQTRGRKRFQHLHGTGTLFPWRCLVCCPSFGPATELSNPLRSVDARGSFVHEALPGWLERALELRSSLAAFPRDLFPDGPAARFLVATLAEA